MSRAGDVLSGPDTEIRMIRLYPISSKGKQEIAVT